MKHIRKNRKRISERNIKFENLLESDLDQATSILAAKNISSGLQTILGKLSDISSKEVMALVGNISTNFSPDQASDFESNVNQAIQGSIDSIKSSIDTVNNAILVLTGEQPASNDMAQDDGSEEMPTLDDSDMSQDTGTDDTSMDNSGDEQVAGGTDNTQDNSSPNEGNPQGRAKKESFANNKKILESHGRKVLQEQNITTLMNWLFEHTSTTMAPDDFKTFSKKAISQAIENPEKMAGWIASKQASVSSRAQIMTPQVSQSAKNSGLSITMERKKAARSVARKIEENIKTTGRSNLPSILHEAIKFGHKNITESFKAVYGIMPSEYASKARMIIEAGQAVPVAPVAPVAPISSGGTDAQNIEDQKDSDESAVGKLASKVASDPSTGTKSVDDAISDMDDNEKKEIRDVENKASNDGNQINNVNDLIKSSNSAIGESKKKSKIKRKKKPESILAPLAIGEEVKKEKIEDNEPEAVLQAEKITTKKTKIKKPSKSKKFYSSGQSNGPGDGVDAVDVTYDPTPSGSGGDIF